MEVNKAILDELIRISDHLDRLEKTTEAIDISIRGDEGRGVVGMKQRMNTIEKVLKEHTDNDEREFSSIKELINRTGGIVAGAVIVIGAVWSFLTFLAK